MKAKTIVSAPPALSVQLKNKTEDIVKIKIQYARIALCALHTKLNLKLVHPPKTEFVQTLQHVTMFSMQLTFTWKQ